MNIEFGASGNLAFSLKFVTNPDKSFNLPLFPALPRIKTTLQFQGFYVLFEQNGYKAFSKI